MTKRTVEDVTEVSLSASVQDSGPQVRRRWFKYAGIKPERSRGRQKNLSDEVASLSNLEAESMDILWDLNRAASAMEVLEFSLYKRRDAGEEPISFPALQSTLRRLAEKGVLVSERDDYRTIRYRPTIEREEMTARILNNVALKLLAQPLHSLLPKMLGSVSPIKADAIPEDEMVSLQKLIDAIEELSIEVEQPV